MGEITATDEINKRLYGVFEMIESLKSSNTDGKFSDSIVSSKLIAKELAEKRNMLGILCSPSIRLVFDESKVYGLYVSFLGSGFCFKLNNVDGSYMFTEIDGESKMNDTKSEFAQNCLDKALIEGEVKEFDTEEELEIWKGVKDKEQKDFESGLSEVYSLRREGKTLEWLIEKGYDRHCIENSFICN